MKPIYIAAVLAVLCIACDPFANPKHAVVTFSSDTLFFDTVFTSMGSTTMEVRAKNLTDRPLLIEKIWLAGGKSSPFRININGSPLSELSNITVAAGDSIFLFVDVEIDPSGNDQPVFVVDSIMFLSGDYSSRIILEAWGQDIIIIRDDTIGSTTWGGGRPYVIYGSVLVDTLATLTVTEGARLFFHNKASMKVAGSIVINGSDEHQVIIGSDRTSDDYEDIPGQWKGITFYSCSTTNRIKDAVIRNAVIALDIAGDPLSGRPVIDVENVSVIHNSVNSLRAVYADVTSSNSLFSHTGFSTVSILNGSNASFTHCTIANRWGYNVRTESSLYIGKGSSDTGVLPSVSVFNSVVTGDLDNEMEIDALPFDLAGKILFDSCLVEIDTLECEWWNRKCFNGVIIGKEPKFIDWYTYDFRPDTLSSLLDAAGRIKAMPFAEDIRHKPRPAFGRPDIGAYERQPGEKSD